MELILQFFTVDRKQELQLCSVAWIGTHLTVTARFGRGWKFVVAVRGIEPAVLYSRRMALSESSGM